MIQLELTLQEVNLVLHALTQRPYAEVHELFPKIATQAAEQAKKSEKKE